MRSKIFYFPRVINVICIVVAYLLAFDLFKTKDAKFFVMVTAIREIVNSVPFFDRSLSTIFCDFRGIREIYLDFEALMLYSMFPYRRCL